MKTRLVFALCALSSVAACDRGPEIPANAEAPAPPTRPAQLPMAGARPQQMPPTQGALPGNHPPMAGTPTGATPSQGVAPPPPAELDPAHPSLAGVAWSVPEGLTPRPPANNMRAAEYVASGEAGEAVLAVSFFPGMAGSVDDNVQRWVGQFTTADGHPVPGDHSQQSTVGGLNVTRVDVTGNYVGMAGDGGQGQRLLGLIVQAPTGPVFFKLVGPTPTVAAAEPAFDALMQTIHPAG